MNTVKSVLGFVLLALSLSFAAPLSEGNVTSCGVISAPGDYYVQHPGITTLGTSLDDCLVVQSSDVRIFCQGHSVSAPEDPSMGKPIRGYAIYINGPYNNILVDGCVLENSLSGLFASGPSHLTASNNIARGNLFYGFEGRNVSDSSFTSNSVTCPPPAEPSSAGTMGFRFTNLGTSTVSNNDVDGCISGMHFESSSQNTISHNSVTNLVSAAYAFAYDSDNNQVSSCTASGGGYGFSIFGGDSNLPDGNTFSGCEASGGGIGFSFFDTGTGNEVTGSTIEENVMYGINVVKAPETALTRNTLENNGGDSLTSILLYESPNSLVEGNTVMRSPEGIAIGLSDGTVVRDNLLENLGIAIGLSSEGIRIISNIAEDCGVAFYSLDYYDGNVVERLSMVDATREVVISFTYQHGTGNGLRIGLDAPPAAAPAGYESFNGKYFFVEPIDGTVGTDMYVHWRDAELGTFNESEIRAFSHTGSPWSQYSGLPDTSANKILFKYMESPGTVGIFVNTGYIPPTPPVPPSGGSSGGSSGGTTHGGGGSGAPHIGIPYVPSGSSGGTTVSVEPSCTSDSDCASSAECSGGICTALEAGSSCGAFVDHEWADYECCGTEDCDAGEVCRDNECVSMEPLDFAGTEPQGSGSESSDSDQGLGRLLADIPWWVLLILVLMVGGGIYARYRMGQSSEPADGEESSDEEMPPAEPEEE